MTGQSSQALVCRISRSQEKPRLVIENVTLPALEQDQVLVKCISVAQNPTDVQSFDSNAFGDDAVLGCDFSGLVVEIGEGVTRVAKGDRIAGLIWGGETQGLGAYSQYTIANEKICFQIPENVTDPEAATVPLALTTAWLALFSKTSLAIDRLKGQEISLLVWGGSSSVGLYALQIARIYGFKVATVCSPRHSKMCKEHGATHVFDYRSASVIEDIKKAIPDITYGFDCIGSTTSSAQAAAALRKEGATLCTVRPGKGNTENVGQSTKVTDVLVWTAFLKDHRYGPFFWPASAEDHTIATELYEELPDYLRSGRIKPSCTRILEGGFAAVPEGFQMNRDGKISGFKIVYNI